MAREPFWKPFDDFAEESRRRRSEPDVLSELTLALDATTWFRGQEAGDDCAP